MVRTCRAVHPPVVLKVILETAALAEQQICFAADVAQTAGVDFVKTSTGLHPAGGASIDDVRLLGQAAPGCRVKAAGGIRTAEQVQAMLAAGAKRIGTSAGVAIMASIKQTPT